MLIKDGSPTMASDDRHSFARSGQPGEARASTEESLEPQEEDPNLYLASHIAP